jgi:hypothetical protein
VIFSVLKRQGMVLGDLFAGFGRRCVDSFQKLVVVEVKVDNWGH